MRPIHPGGILREEFLVPLGMSAHALSQAIRVPATRVNDIVNGKRGITTDTALRLARYFANSLEFWLNLQAAYDLRTAEREAAAKIEREVSPREAAWRYEPGIVGSNPAGSRQISSPSPRYNPPGIWLFGASSQVHHLT